jgi:hypothetical protein
MDVIKESALKYYSGAEVHFLERKKNPRTKVTHLDTNHAQRCLTSVIHWELVHSLCCRRWSLAISVTLGLGFLFF